MNIKVGKITHYFNKIGVAVLQVNGKIKIGDTMKISGHDKEFSQKISSMQIDYKNIVCAKKGDSIGFKVDQEVKEGDLVYKIG